MQYLAICEDDLLFQFMRNVTTDQGDVRYLVPDAKFAQRIGRRIEPLSEECKQRLKAYAWPGNVRELQNVIERAVILSKGPALQVAIADLRPEAPPASAAATAASVTLTDAERDHILRVVRETNWVLGGPKGAAVRLGMKRSTLHWKMKKLGISRPT